MSVPITKKRKLGSKTVDCIFLGYAIHSIGHRFLIVKSGVLDMHIGTIMESRDATFFENIFPMRDEISLSRPEFIENDNFTEPIEHSEPTLWIILRRIIMKLLERVRDKLLQSLLVMTSLYTSWMIHLELLQRHIHILILSIRRKQNKE